jgi:hypothetical protein
MNLYLIIKPAHLSATKLVEVLISSHDLYFYENRNPIKPGLVIKSAVLKKRNPTSIQH